MAAQWLPGTLVARERPAVICVCGLAVVPGDGRHVTGSRAAAPADAIALGTNRRPPIVVAPAGPDHPVCAGGDRGRCRRIVPRLETADRYGRARRPPRRAQP